MCALALPTNSSASERFSLRLEPPRFGLEVSAADEVLLADLESGAVLGSFAHGTAVTYAGRVAAFEVRLLRLSVQGVQSPSPWHDHHAATVV